jgi:glycosyltransferase involved in cell wall biosynthesis
MSDERHVLIIVENLPVPFDARVWQEATALREAGYEVSVICPKGVKEHREEYQELDGVRIYRHDLPLEANGALGYLLEYWSALVRQRELARRIFEERPFQVLQACNPPDLIFLVAKAFKRRGVSFVFDHHDLSPELYIAKFGRRDLFYRLLLFLERRTFANADYSIATNESYKKVAIERGGMASDKVIVVRSGPSLQRLFPVAPNDVWKRGRRYMAAYVGVIGRQEGLDYLLDAARHIRLERGREDLQFIVMGSGPDLERVRAEAAEMGVSDMVEFTGRVPNEQLREVLSTADVCVNPDEYNEMNDKSTMNKVMEYMAMGKPVVQFDLREGRASAGESSLYCSPNDAVDLGEKILWLLDRPEERERMGHLGRERVIHELAWQYEKPKYVALYDRVFSERGLSPIERGR